MLLFHARNIERRLDIFKYDESKEEPDDILFYETLPWKCRELHHHMTELAKSDEKLMEILLRLGWHEDYYKVGEKVEFGLLNNLINYGGKLPFFSLRSYFTILENIIVFQKSTVFWNSQLIFINMSRQLKTLKHIRTML